MLNRLIIFQVIFGVLQGIQGQPGSSGLERQIDELRARIKSLEKENELIAESKRAEDSLAYCLMRSEIFDAFTRLNQLDFDFQATSGKIAVTGLFTRLMQANNPTSDILGFQFTEVILAAAEKNLGRAIKDGKDRKRFSQVLGNIIGNPVVSSLANTNPITSVVAALISCVAGFTTSRVEMDKEGSRIRDVSVQQEEVFNNDCISAFREDLQIYIDFYDALILASKQYLAGLDELGRKYGNLLYSVETFKYELHRFIGTEERDLLIKLASTLPDPSTDKINFALFLNDPEYRQCQRIAQEYPALQREVSAFEMEYHRLLFEFLSDYKKILAKAIEFPGETIDRSRTGTLIRDIDAFIDSEKIRETLVPDP